MTLRRVPLWCWLVLLIIVLSAPWRGFTTEPQWNRLHLVPFSDPEDKPWDLISNIGIFIPFGYLFCRWTRVGQRVLLTVAVAAAVSVCAEAPQLFSTLRNPSGTDVFAAVVGALAGAFLRIRHEKARLRSNFPPA